LELNAQALKNLGLTQEYLQPIVLRDYKRTITVPAIVAAKPGRTQIRVSSPLSGVVTHVHAVTGEAVTAGELLFEVRLTYEDLVDTQTQFLKTLSELEVEKREIARLEEITQSGAISAKSLLERRYSKEKIEAYLGSMREALKLHGLSASQIATIEMERKLLRDLSIETPDIDSHNKNEELRLTRLPFKPASFTANVLEEPIASKRPLIVEDLKIQKGQGVTSGEMLCSLSDFSSLYIEGQAFEQDAPTVTKAAQNGWMIDAMIQTTTDPEVINGLKLAFVGSSVDPTSRTLSFFVELPNQILRDEKNDQGQRFLTWKYRVGQRLQLQVPVEVWTDQLVLPVDAVVKDGADWFAFQQNGDHFDRIAVHVKHRDQTNVVIDNDGVLFPGDVVALRAAHQLQMALKNKSGGGVDPHAGHNH
jgi:multidrug efflux pump subunit AcrA (membrane-fusion protein)